MHFVFDRLVVRSYIFSIHFGALLEIKPINILSEIQDAFAIRIITICTTCHGDMKIRVFCVSFVSPTQISVSMKYANVNLLALKIIN